MFFDKILCLPENKGAKIEDYGIKYPKKEVLAILTNGNKYLVKIDENANPLSTSRTNIEPTYKTVHYTEPGRKCLYYGVIPPRNGSYREMIW